MSMTRVLSHRSRWSIHSHRRENPTKTVTLGRKISLPEKAPFGGQSANPMKTVTWAAGRCPPGARFRVHLGDGGVHGPAVARPADASGNQDCALSEVGDLAHWTAIGGHCPDVGRCAVLERDGEPSVVGREREAVGIPGNPRSRVSIQDAFAIWRTGFEDLVAELIPSPRNRGWSRHSRWGPHPRPEMTVRESRRSSCSDCGTISGIPSQGEIEYLHGLSARMGYETRGR